jgi:hypothetical protein
MCPKQVVPGTYPLKRQGLPQLLFMSLHSSQKSQRKSLEVQLVLNNHASASSIPTSQYQPPKPDPREQKPSAAFPAPSARALQPHFAPQKARIAALLLSPASAESQLAAELTSAPSEQVASLLLFAALRRKAAPHLGALQSPPRSQLRELAGGAGGWEAGGIFEAGCQDGSR